MSSHTVIEVWACVCDDFYQPHPLRSKTVHCNIVYVCVDISIRIDSSYKK